MTTPDLPLASLHDRHPGVTQALAETYEQAASVCIDRHHQPPTNFSLQEGERPATDVRLQWVTPSDRAKAAWANKVDATRDGAYGCVLASVELTREYFAVRRAETGSGADYYVGPRGAGLDDLEDCMRLEVSGVDEGGMANVRKRLAAKVRQVQQGEGSLPALAGVVGFQAASILLADVGEE